MTDTTALKRVKLGLILLTVSNTNFPIAFGKEHNPCDLQHSLQGRSAEIIADCSLADVGHHLLCSGGLHGQWISGSESIRVLTLCDWHETSFDPVETLRKFPSLKKLTLTGSNVMNLSNSFPAEVPFLEKIVITGTRIRELPASAFRDSTHLRSLDLRKNQLNFIDPSDFNATRLQHVYLSGNPWKCDANMSWILDTKHSAFGRKVSDREKMHCGAPYEDRPLVPVVEIIITLKEECKKTVCDCELVYVVGRVSRQPRRQLMAFVTVNCSYRGLTQMPDFLPANATTLHLKGNQISDLTPLTTNPVYKQVIDLYMDGNLIESITHLDGSYWLEHFRVLSLRGNRLTDLPTYALENVLLQSGSAIRIYLGDNPWRCDCLFTPGFQDLLIRYTNLVKDVNDVRCHSAVNKENLNKQIRDLTRTEICIDPSSLSWLHPLDVLNVILASLIVLIVGKLLYDYWYFKRTGKLPWIVAKIP
ncbi:protein singed wings 2 [Venturia canescens]|uniref:protein singed wings 2 n=1 Tax=Venturia canescens TaxID=32260 RepID=UPI001C9D4E46|nr:protein singed wings 2 [Venturia canescens]